MAKYGPAGVAVCQEVLDDAVAALPNPDTQTPETQEAADDTAPAPAGNSAAVYANIGSARSCDEDFVAGIAELSREPQPA